MPNVPTHTNHHLCVLLGIFRFLCHFRLIACKSPYAIATQVTSKPPGSGVKSPIFAGFSPPSDPVHWRRWPSMELQPPREDNKRYCNIEFSWYFLIQTSVARSYDDYSSSWRFHWDEDELSSIDGTLDPDWYWLMSSPYESLTNQASFTKGFTRPPSNKQTRGSPFIRGWYCHVPHSK